MKTPKEQEHNRRKKIAEHSKRFHRYSKLDVHLHQESINEEITEAMIEYGYVSLAKAILRNGIENEGVDYMKSEDGQFWTAIVRKGIKENRE